MKRLLIPAVLLGVFTLLGAANTAEGQCGPGYGYSTGRYAVPSYGGAYYGYRSYGSYYSRPSYRSYGHYYSPGVSFGFGYGQPSVRFYGSYHGGHHGGHH
jgi:hypothetical protein